MSTDIIHLRAGAFTLDFEAGDLRRISLGGTVVVSRIYAAVRDEGWNTVPGAIRDLEVRLGERSFRIAYTAEHAAGAVRFSNRVELSGGADGRIAMAMRGTARSSFSRNRIGLCVHHPHTCAGAWVRIGHAGGGSDELRFPEAISPHQPFLDVASITTRPGNGAEVEVRFAGEVFETEDQRNWGDASFKTYGTPLALPRPAAVASGTVIEQRVEVELTGRAMPTVAADIAALPHPPAVLAGLRNCRLDRLRLAIDLSGAWGARIDAVRSLSEALDLPIDLVVVGDPAGTPLREAMSGLRLASLVAVPADRSTTPAAWVATLRALRPSLPVGGGSSSQFTEVNRDRPSAEGWQVLAFPVCPYVHAIDAASLLENIPALGAIAASARVLAPSAAIHLALAHARQEAHPELAARHAGELGGRWLRAALDAAEGVAVLSCGPTTGAMGLVLADGTPTPAGEVLAAR